MPVSKPSLDDIRWTVKPSIDDYVDNDYNDPTSGQPNTADPPEDSKLKGWQFKQWPPRQWFNWLFRKYFRWFQWINAHVSDQYLLTGTVNQWGGTSFPEDVVVPTGWDKTNTIVLSVRLSRYCFPMMYPPTSQDPWFLLFWRDDYTNRLALMFSPTLANSPYEILIAKKSTAWPPTP